MGTGEVHLAMGETERGLALLDDAMADVLAGQVSTLIVGVIYCAVLEACQRLMDVRRSQEWTAAFTRWCESQPDLVPFRGDCMVYRAEVMQLRGAWPDAMAEALKVCAAATIRPRARGLAPRTTARASSTACAVTSRVLKRPTVWQISSVMHLSRG